MEVVGGGPQISVLVWTQGYCSLRDVEIRSALHHLCCCNSFLVKSKLFYEDHVRSLSCALFCSAVKINNTEVRD